MLTALGSLLVCYQNKEFLAAQNCFNRVLHVHPDDKSAQLYLKRCHYFQKYGTDGDWEGVEVMENKGAVSLDKSRPS